MSRADALGLFWEDIKKERIKKEIIKRTPPPRTWEDPSYLPFYEEACKLRFERMTDEDIGVSAYNGDRLLFDCEVYPNYFLISFRSLLTRKIAFYERCDDLDWNLDYGRLGWIVDNCCVVGFNSKSYDEPIVSIALAGRSNIEIKAASDAIIQEGLRPWEVQRAYKGRRLKMNHIDLIEVAPVAGSLKAYGSRIFTRQLADLPFAPQTLLSPEQITVCRWYNINDLDITEDLYRHTYEQVRLREQMSARYSVDLRSKSDAQIAEAIISKEVEKLNGAKIDAPFVDEGTTYWFNVPDYMQFKSDLGRYILNLVATTPFVVGGGGAVLLPEILTKELIKMGHNAYRMGIGGLHSTEESIAHVSDSDYQIFDFDVASYYPRIILNLGLFPPHMGHAFLRVYDGIVQQRLDAKKTKDIQTALMLKIVLNGTFGKLSNPFSSVYAPEAGYSVTVSGQLILLMLIETFELEQIQVISANTDGVTVRVHRSKVARMRELVKEWEHQTNFEMEEVEYLGMYSRDVNNYIAVKAPTEKEPFVSIKSKGAFSNPWADPKLHEYELHKNPQNLICIEALTEYLTHGTPLEDTIRNCTDIRKFITVRAVTGGAVGSDGTYLGKQIRWYYARETPGEIIYAKSGNKVARSDGAQPLMRLPEGIPVNLDVEWYIQEAYGLMRDIGMGHCVPT